VINTSFLFTQVYLPRVPPLVCMLRESFSKIQFPKRFIFSKCGNRLHAPKIQACTLYWQKINCGYKRVQKKGFSMPCVWQVVIMSVQMQLGWSVITF